MTVSYATYGGHFGRILLRWRGSIWRSLWHELVVYLLLYTIISMIYRFGLGAEGQVVFEKIAYHCRDYTKAIPLTFLLGFYVGLVVKRWWDQFHYMPWPDTVMLWVSAYLRGEENESVRRRIARYIILSTTLAFRSLSIRVYKRFPTLEHVQQAGLMTDSERRYYDEIKLKYQHHHDRWFLPLNWILSLFMQRICPEEGETSVELKQLIQSIEDYRHGLETLFTYDWISVPLVYTQVVTIAVYGYFSLCLISNQYLSSKTKNELDLYVPFFTILQFLFYVGWLRVAEDLINPFGEDDEDFEMNYLLDRHTEMAFLLVNIHGQLPAWQPTLFDVPMLEFDGYPDTVASERLGRDSEPECHVRRIVIPPAQQAYYVHKGKQQKEEERPQPATIPNTTYVSFATGATFAKEKATVSANGFSHVGEFSVNGAPNMKYKQLLQAARARSDSSFGQRF